MGAEPIVRVRDLYKSFVRGSEEIKVLADLTVDVDRRRVPRAHGPVRLRQDDAAEPDRRARPADRRAKSTSATT